MHPYFDLVLRAARITLNALHKADERNLSSLPPGNTEMVKNLQATCLQKAITAVGMFSMFESILQDRLRCEDGFAEVRVCLEDANERELLERFEVFAAAINVLKHGKGRSYDNLLRAPNLPFRIARPDSSLFPEGHLIGITALVDVDDQFVLDCATIIKHVSEVVTRVRDAHV